MKRFTFVCLLVIQLCDLSAQSKKSWPHIPGFDPALPTTLNSKESFIGVSALAIISFALEEFVFQKHENVSYYSARLAMNKEYAFGLKNVWQQNLGVEYRLASWFSVSADFNLQEWSDQTPLIENREKFGLGMGLMSYYRWYLLGKKRISPFIEYGSGLFWGFKEFPYNGTKFSVNHSTQLGLEYSLQNENKLRLSYGHFHQSNYNWLASNPAYDAYGFSIAYAWKLK